MSLAQEGEAKKAQDEEEQQQQQQQQRQQQQQQQQQQSIPTLSVSSACDYHLQGMVDGVPARLLVDTGAAATLINRTVWDRICQRNGDLQLEKVTGKRLVGVQGSPLQILGSSQVKISLSREEFESSVLVVDCLTTEVILGRDFLSRYKCTVDVGENLIHFKEKGVTMCLDCPPGGQQIARISVTLGTTLSVPPQSEIEVMATVSKSAVNGMWMIEGCHEEKLSVLIARSLVLPTREEVPIRLMNPRSECVTVKQGTVVAEMEAFQEEQSITTAAVQEDPLSQDSTSDAEVRKKLVADMVTRDGAHLCDSEKKQLSELLLEFGDVLATGPEDFGRTSRISHRIHTADSHPIRQPVRRIPPFRKQEVQQLVDGMLRKGVIQPSASPWASPIVLVRKKDGSTRFCVDYRKVNSVTRKDAYPLPRIDDTLDTLAGSQLFSTLDLISGYWQVEVDSKDREKTAFCTPLGFFEFRVMPFGLCNAPATFQRLMDLVLAGLQWTSCLVYLDDVIIVGKTFEEHLLHLREVLIRLREAGLKLQPSKCSFCQKKVAFLGHIVSDKGVATDPAKTAQVAKWPTPSSQKEVQQFLGLASYYRRFVKDFATIAKPLHRLTEKTMDFKWTSECQSAFEELRRNLTAAPILAFPDFEKPFILDTDASDFGVGAVLSQVQDDGTERAIAYASRVLSKPERRYCVTRRELLAVVTFIQHFRPYLLGRRFTLRTDHGSLTWLSNFRNPEGQLARWLEKLQEYDFEILHRSGRKHGNADAMSRMPCTQCGRSDHSEENTILAAVHQTRSPFPGRSQEELRQLQLEDPSIGYVFRAKEKDRMPATDELKGQSLEVRRLIQLWSQLAVVDGVLLRCFEDDSGKASWMQLVVPRALRDEVMEEIHSGVTGGHLGEERTTHQLRQRFYWPGFFQDIRNFLRTCATCATRKSKAPKPRAPLQTIQAGYPMQTVAVDIMGPLPESDSGNSYILVVGDYFTRWMEAYAIPDQEAITVAKKLVDECFCRFSPPDQLHSDQGKQFESNLIKEICQIFNIDKTRTTAYHPQCDGLVERFNRTLQDMIATTIKDHPFDWEGAIRKVCFAYNSSVHSTTGHTPFFLMFGRETKLPIDLAYGTQTQDVTLVSQHARDLKKTLEQAYDKVRQKLAAGHEKRKEIYDRKIHGEPFKPGDHVWLFNPAVARGKSKKLHHPWTGPFRVLKKLSDCDYRIKGRRSPIVVHFNRLKLCVPGTRLDHSPPGRDAANDGPSTLGPDDHRPQIGEGLEILDSDEPGRDAEPPARYPSRQRRPPAYLSPFVSH